VKVLAASVVAACCVALVKGACLDSLMAKVGCEGLVAVEPRASVAVVFPALAAVELRALVVAAPLVLPRALVVVAFPASVTAASATAVSLHVLEGAASNVILEEAA
jgi:hypothetical protein